MSEKRKIQRFNLDEGRIWEVIEGLSPFKTTYTLEEVCEKLNEQQAIIEQLKKEYKIAIDEMVTDYKKLEEENEQLKKENKRLKERNDELEDELEESSAFIIEQRKENKTLKEENEQLRKQLDFYLLDEFEWKEKYGD